MACAVTLAALQHGVAIEDESGVTELAETVHIDLAAPGADEEDGRQTSVLLDGNDVTWTIRTPIVDKHVSPVAAYAGVHAALTVQQRRIAQRYGRGDADKPGIVLVGSRHWDSSCAGGHGQDLYGCIGRKSAPAAAISNWPGAARWLRFERMSSRYFTPRSGIDSHRAVRPLHAADDAVHVDTTGMSPEAVVAAVAAAIRQKMEEQGCSRASERT